MEHVIILVKFISILFCFGLLVFINQLRMRYKHTFLDYFYSFYLFCLFSLLAQLLIKYTATNLLMEGSFDSFLVFNLIFMASLLAFTAGAAYNYILMTLRFLHEEYEKTVRIIFIILLSFTGLFFLYLSRFYFITKSSLMLTSFTVVFIRALLVFMVLSNIRLFFSFGKIKSRQRTFLVLLLAGYYTLLFLFHFVTYRFVLVRQAGLAGALFYLLLTVPPLFLIKRLTDNYFGIIIRDEAKEERISRLYEEKKISKREEEIIRYVCEGMSNKQIAWDLSLSEQTVKHHIYNIYQKFGINSRVELINIIHSV